MHPQLRQSAIFVYDQYPGGIGLAEKGFHMLDRLLERTLELIATCDCEQGCPSCIHFPTCGHGNVPLDKSGAIHLLELLTNRRSLDLESLDVGDIESEPPDFAPWEMTGDTGKGEEPPSRSRPSPHIVVFDLESQRSAAEVGGWHKTYLMRMSCGVAWDSRDNCFVTYMEDRVEELLEHLRSADLVVGFNVIGFDYSVLSGYTRYDFAQLNTLDIMRDVHTHLNYRVSLDGLAQATLNKGKTADGLQALRWWKEERLDLIESYCRDDVSITRDIFYHGAEKGYLLFDRKQDGRMRLPVNWHVEGMCTVRADKPVTSAVTDRRLSASADRAHLLER